MTNAQKHTHLQTAPTPPANQSLQKSVFLPTQKRILFFSPFLRCFNFFATHDQNINNTTQTAKVFIYKHFQTQWTRTPAANSVLPQLAVTCKIEAECSYQTFVQVDSEVLRNRQLRQHAKRYASP
jgi:hypothetical protein